jgi:hypothetical protein
MTLSVEDGTTKEISYVSEQEAWFDLAREFPNMLKGMGYIVDAQALSDFYGDFQSSRVVETYNS